MLIRHLSPKRNRWYERSHEYFQTCCRCSKKKPKSTSKNCLTCRDEIKRKPISERFYKFVKKTHSCWIWTGAKSRGYGQIYDPKKRRPEKAYRVSWEIVHGEIPSGFEVLHNCPERDNPACVNPDHLKLGTHADNMRDASEKGQMARGEESKNAKLNSKNIRIIKRLYSEFNLSRDKISKLFQVSPGTIQCIVEGKTWKHV